jgi:hypothetical protein
MWGENLADYLHDASSQACRRVLDVQAHWTDQPLETIRSFVDDLVREMDTFANGCFAAKTSKSFGRSNVTSARI